MSLLWQNLPFTFTWDFCVKVYLNSRNVSLIRFEIPDPGQTHAKIRCFLFLFFVFFYGLQIKVSRISKTCLQTFFFPAKGADIFAIRGTLNSYVTFDIILAFFVDIFAM